MSSLNPPPLREPKREQWEIKGITSTDPRTVNPAAGELKFDAAASDRDVAARLNEYANAEGVRTDMAAPTPEGAIPLSLEEALKQSQRTGRELLSAQEQYISSAISLLIERHLWGPRLFNDTTFGFAGSGDNGRFANALNVINNMRVTQRLPYGGSVEAAWVFDASEQLREVAGARYTQSSSLVLSGNLPLLRGAGDVAREDLIQAERNLVYEARSFERFRRQYLVSIAVDYFELLNTLASISNQEHQLDALRKNATTRAALVDAGRIEAFEKGIADNEVLNAQAGLASLREQYILQLERYKIRLGLPVEQPLTLSQEIIDLPEPEIGLDEAAQIALDYRLDLQNDRDRLDDMRRNVENARNNELPDLNLTANTTLPTNPNLNRGGLNFDPENVRYGAGVTLGLPLDREQERLSTRQAVINLQRAIRDYTQRRDNVAVSVRSALRNVELARFQLKLAEQQVEINKRRLRGQELQAGTVATQTILDSQNALLNAENQRDRARTNLRTAVLNYLLESDQLRVSADGQLERLPGMGGAGTAPQMAK
ncbi:MAG: TolC family protein [Phycisphaerales bacterium]